MVGCLKVTTEPQPQNSTNWIRIVKTVLLILTFIGWGMSNSIVYAVIPDLRIRLNTTVEGMSSAFSFGILGCLVSTPLGILADRVGSYSGLILGFCLILTSLTATLKPFTSTVWQFTICEFLDIVGWTLMCSVSNSLLVLMWGEKGTSPLHAMHLGYPIGASFGGLIAGAFVSTKAVDRTENSSVILNASSTYATHSVASNSSVSKTFGDESRIEIGFIIIACFIVTLGILFIVFQFTGSKETRKRANKKSYHWKVILHPSQWGAYDSKFALILLVLYFLIQVVTAGCDKGIALYLAAYAVDSGLGFSNQEAATLTSFNYLFDGIGLFLGIFVARFLSLKTMFLIEAHIMTLTGLLFILLGAYYKLALYILVALFSLFKGPAFAAMYAWPDYYIILLTTILAVANILRSICEALITYIQGYLYTNAVIESIFYTTLGYGVCLCVLMYVVFFVTWKKPGRHSFASEDPTKTENEATAEKEIFMESLDAAQSSL